MVLVAAGWGGWFVVGAVIGCEVLLREVSLCAGAFGLLAVAGCCILLQAVDARG